MLLERQAAHLWILHTVLHHVLPDLVNSLKELPLLRHLLHDVCRTEDGLQVEPLGLHLEPLVYGVLDTDKALLPSLWIITKWLLLFHLQNLWGWDQGTMGKNGRRVLYQHSCVTP